jgi:hypothetical protein
MACFHARLGLMFSFKLSAQRLQMNSGATAPAVQLSLRGLNSERIEQTVLGSQKRRTIPKKLTEQGSKLSFDCLIATLFSAQWLPREALQLLVCVLLQLVVFWSAPSKI